MAFKLAAVKIGAVNRRNSLSVSASRIKESDAKEFFAKKETSIKIYNANNYNYLPINSYFRL